MFNYNEIGKKIKLLAKMSFIVEAIGAIITGIAFLIDWGLDAWWALFIIFFGPIVAWVGSWLLYGFGEIIDKLCDIEENTRKNGKKTAFPNNDTTNNNNKRLKIKNLLDKGLITEEEYIALINKQGEENEM